LIEKSKIDYVAFELFRLELLRRNPRTTDKQISTLWARGRKSYWRDRAENAMLAIKRWEGFRGITEPGEAG
jgi:hypothetical protein